MTFAPDVESRDQGWVMARRALHQHVPTDEIPVTADLLNASQLEGRLDTEFTMLVVGDIMLAGRARKPIAANGPRYPFEAVRPLLQKSTLVLGNLEGPFAVSKKLPRTHSYRVPPRLATALAEAGFDIVNLANNHLLDCGRSGVIETLETLTAAGIAALGAGYDETSAHTPIIRQVGPMRIGLLGYYWNRRCAASPSLAGCAMDVPDLLAADIQALRPKVDRLVVSHHWGVPYEREPSSDDQAKARLAIDCGADIVVGHHSHVVGPVEIYRGRPIFYSIGNFVFGSGNSRAEGLALGIRFESGCAKVTVIPVYVKNRDPRVEYQPKVMVGNSADRLLRKMTDISGASATRLQPVGDWRQLVLAHANPAPRET